jgi:hypothetical protein
MKKILSSSLILATLAVAFTGCLKDKGFDNHTYGINDADTQPPGVGFPLGATAKNTIGLDAGVATNQAINNIVWVNLEGGSPAKSDVHVTLVLNDALRVAYNTANGTNILAMPAAYYNVALTVVIPAGATGGMVPINIPSTVPLDPSNSYGVGLTITAVDGGYRIASNLKNLFLEFTLKNKYDGTYACKVATQGWGAYGITDEPTFYDWGPAGTATILLITGGPNTVRVFDDYAFGDFIQICHTGVGGGGISGFGATAPRYWFNTATDLLVNVTNDIPDDGRGRKFDIDPRYYQGAAGAFNGNFWNPANKQILADYILHQNGRPDEYIQMILTYKGPR